MSATAIYHRVSTRDQNPGLARDELQQAAAARRLTVRDVVEETGSGARNDRPGLRRVLDLAERGSIECLIVWKLDRLGRSAVDLLAVVKRLQAAGVRLVATSQGLDVRPGGDAMSNLILTVLAAVAEFELEIIRERTALGIEGARRAGKRLGRPPTVPDEVAGEAATLAGEGLSWRAVARALRLKGRGDLSPAALRRAVQARAKKDPENTPGKAT